MEWSLEPPPKSVPATAVALHLLPSPPPPSMSTGSFAYCLFPSSPPILQAVSTRGSPSTILLHQDAGSLRYCRAVPGPWLLGQQDWAERWRKEHYSSQPRPRARQHFAKPLPPPCSEEATQAPCPGMGGSTSVAAGGEAMGFFGLKPPAVTGRLTRAELTAGPAKLGPPKLRCFTGTPKGALE